MKKFNSDFKYLTMSWGLLILILIPTFAHHGHLLVDCGREAYYPTQILLGKVLYKDIFNIYGPFSYMFNAVLFKIFGINLNVLYLSGCVCAFLIVTLTYLIARKFFSEFLSFTICALISILGVLNTSLFNFIFPYSYGMLYGTVAVLLSILLLLKYSEKSEKNFYLYLSSFFAGLCIVNKYEFLPYILVIFYAAYKIKPLKFKQYSLLLLSLIIAPAFCFAILFLQGLRVADLTYAVLIINKMMHTKTLNYFYKHTGVFYHKDTLFMMFKNFLKALFSIALIFLATTRKKKIFAAFWAIISIIFILQTTDITSFAFLPILISLWFIFNFKNIYNNTKLMILTLSSILLSMKVYWGLLALSYGTYIISLPIITIIALIFDKFKDRKINPLIISSYLIIISISFCFILGGALKDKSLAISTARGELYPERFLVKSTSNLIKYIQTNTKKTDTVMIFPEGQLINFLTERKSDDIYGSLIPLYVETFGEDNIIEHFKKTKPEYIIFNSWNYHEYYFKYICNDYAQNFCAFVAQNYAQEKVIDNDGFRYLIFKLKTIN